MTITRSFLLALSAVLVLPALGVSAEDGNVTGNASLVPRSDRVIKGDLKFPDGQIASFVSRDGTWVTVENHRTGEFFGFSGVIGGSKRQPVPNFIAYQIHRISLQSSDVKQLTRPQNTPVVDSQRGPFTTLRTPDGTPVEFAAVRATGLDEWSFATPAGLDPSQYTAAELQPQYESGSSVCCVTCDSRTVCATSVSTFCGNCSAGGGGGS